MRKVRTHKVIFVLSILLSLMLFVEGARILTNWDSLISNNEPSQDKSHIRLGQIDEGVIPAQKLEPVNVLVLGLDGEEVRSDVIILLNFSPVENKLNILSIARDTKVRVKNRTSKINALIHIGGEKLVAEKIRELTGLNVHYYITLNFEGFRKVVDTLDGVQMDVPIDMNYDDPDQNLHIHLKKGLQTLNGAKAEHLVRYRKGNRRGEGYEDGDIGRIKMQQEFIKALIDQKLKLKYISKTDDIYFILRKYMKSNIELNDINRYLKHLQSLKFEEIKSYTLPGETAYISELWYFICDPEETRKLINDHFFK
ncbi:MAG: LCP family protein [Clostridia bacterium]|nr:LCP family protein [Clostridia bacterium]